MLSVKIRALLLLTILGTTLTNNDVLRRLRYTFNYNDKKMMALFESAGVTVTREQVCNWLKREGDVDAVNCGDYHLAAFLNGFINEKRGKREGAQPVPEKRINNNIVLTKLKIALNLKAEDIIDLLALADLRIGKSELSAFFRKQDHKHFRQCKDQFLRNFLLGVEKKFLVERGQNSSTQNSSGQNSSAKKGAGQSSSAKAKSHSRTDKPQAKTGYNQATPNASKVYVNPNRTKSNDKKDNGRKVLKLKPSDIYKDVE